MKEITPKEKQAFFDAMHKNNIPYNIKPRSKQEIEQLICIYNTINKTIYFKDKNYQPLDFEREVTAKELFAIIMSSKSSALEQEKH